MMMGMSDHEGWVFRDSISSDSDAGLRTSSATRSAAQPFGISETRWRRSRAMELVKPASRRSSAVTPASLPTGASTRMRDSLSWSGEDILGGKSGVLVCGRSSVVLAKSGDAAEDTVKTPERLADVDPFSVHGKFAKSAFVYATAFFNN